MAGFKLRTECDWRVKQNRLPAPPENKTGEPIGIAWNLDHLKKGPLQISTIGYRFP
jgi:hypothetical protein